MKKSLFLLATILSLSVSAKFSVPKMVKVFEIVDVFSVHYLDSKMSTLSIKVKNLSSKKQTLKAKVTDIAKKEKKGKDIVIFPIYQSLKDQIEKPVNFLPKEEKKLLFKVKRKELPPLSGFKIYPYSDPDKKGNQIIQVMNGIVILSDLEKSLSKVEVDTKGKMTNKGLITVSEFKNLGDQFFYNFSIKYFLINSKNKKIGEKIAFEEFKILSPKNKYKKKIILPVQLKDGEYTLRIFLVNSGNKFIVPLQKKVLVKNKAVQFI